MHEFAKLTCYLKITVIFSKPLPFLKINRKKKDKWGMKNTMMPKNLWICWLLLVNINLQNMLSQ